jgi:hypothetical protein
MDSSRTGPDGVLLITVGGMNAEQINASTPNLHRLAREGLSWPRAYAPSPMTLPSLASLHTGRTPPAHGVRDAAAQELDASQQTLAEILENQGWNTSAYVGTPVGAPLWGLDQGYQTYVHRSILTGPPSNLPDARELVDRALSAPTLEGPSLMWLDLPDLRRVEPESLEHIRALRAIDDAIGRLTEHWAEVHPHGLVIVAGDHGRSTTHPHAEAYLLNDETLRVPLIIAGTHLPAHVHGGVFGLADLVPTLMPLLGLRVSSDWSGVDRLATHKDVPVYSETLAPQTHLGRAPLFALTTDKERYIEGRWGALYASEPQGFSFVNSPTQRALAGALDHPLASALDHHRLPHPRHIAPAVTLDRDTLDLLLMEGVSPGDLSHTATQIDLRDEPHLVDLIDQVYVALEHRTPTVSRDLHRLENTLGDVWALTVLHYLHERSLPRGGNAASVLEEYQIQSPSSTTSMWIGDLYERAGDDLLAHHEYMEALRQDPGSGSAMAAALVVQPLDEGLRQRAPLDAHSEALGHATDQASWSPELALPFAQLACALRPEHVQSHRLAAHLSFEVDGNAEALEETLAWLDHSPDHTPLRIEAARISLELGDPSLAARLLAPAQATLPEHLWVQELHKRAIDSLPTRSPKRGPHHVWRP